MATGAGRDKDGFRNEALTRALDQAIAGDTRALYELLSRASGLPGPRANMGVVEAFAVECSARGKRADALVAKMAALDVDAAPGASKYEILPMCGVMAIGERAAKDPTSLRALATLHDCAEDLRFRVRECVILSLVRIGELRGEPLVHDLASWMDGFFHAAAVLSALSNTQWLAKIDSPTAVLERLDEAFLLLKNAQRAAARYPGHKALMDAFVAAPAPIAARFGVPVFDLLARWATVKDPVLREAIDRSIRGNARLLGRHADEMARVRAAFAATEPPPRNPDHNFGPTRRRGKKQSARR